VCSHWWGAKRSGWRQILEFQRGLPSTMFSWAYSVAGSSGIGLTSLGYQETPKHFKWGEYD